jgi:hypothetical protein
MNYSATYQNSRTQATIQKEEYIALAVTLIGLLTSLITLI